MIGIIGAMEEEVSILLTHMTDKKSETHARMTFYSGKIREKDVVLVKSGVGKVNMAMCTQLMIDRFAPDCVINAGVAGAVAKELSVGDIVVSSEAMQYDMDCTSVGYKIGEVPGLECSVFPADPKLIALAEAAGKKAVPDVRLLTGRVVTGDRFVSDVKLKDWLRDTCGGSCAEMEGAAMAQVCCENGVPYLVLRAISDQADGDAPETFDVFIKKAIQHFSDLMLEMVSEYAL